MKFKHNNIKSIEIRNTNNKYNQEYINNLNLDFDINEYECFEVKKNDSRPYFTVWLKNIERLFRLIPNNLNISEYNLIDIGCGLGISTNYIFKKYKLESYIGVDISEDLIKMAKKINHDLLINFFVKDVANLFLENKKYIIYMFNPFGFKTLKFFLDLNIQNLKNNNSIILYANDLHINEIDECYDVEISRNNIYNLSYIKF